MIDHALKGHPFQFANTYRSSTSGYVEPDAERIHVRHAKAVSEGVLYTLRELFGAQGMHTIFEMAPELRLCIEASVIEAYREGHYDAWLSAGLERGNEASVRTGAMVAAALESARKGEDKEKTALRMLGAFAGVEQEHIDALNQQESK